MPRQSQRLIITLQRQLQLQNVRLKNEKLKCQNVKLEHKIEIKKLHRDFEQHFNQRLKIREKTAEVVLQGVKDVAEIQLKSAVECAKIEKSTARIQGVGIGVIGASLFFSYALLKEPSTEKNAPDLN
ncbi:MAG: hypothetical protein K0R66_1590 [Gammaproteobacteria bacterium]|jgi:hypothetical protein|nr:hypothetical protein [Gammaproteobacteria bacterium]